MNLKIGFEERKNYADFSAIFIRIDHIFFRNQQT